MPEQELITNPTDINLTRDDETQQIFGRPPSYFLRWGITVLFFFFITLAAMAFFIEYPDKVIAPVAVTTENPPIAVVARVGGKVSKLLVNNAQRVTAGQSLMILENTARESDVIQLEKLVELAAQENDAYALVAKSFDDGLQLGNMQTTYALFLQHRQDLKFYLDKQHLSEQRRALQQQIAQLQNLNAALDDQEQTLSSIQEIAVEKRQRYRSMRASGDANAEQLEEVSTALLTAENNLKQLKSQRIGNELKIAEIRTTMLNLRQSDDISSNTKWQQIKADLQQLQREIREWKQNYVLIAPIDGAVSMPKSLTGQQFVEAGEPLLTIVPMGGAGKILAEAQLPIVNSGKVSEQDTVNIRLNGFPYQEFGIIRGVVSEIAAVPNEAGTAYLAKIELSNGLQTTYDRALDFRQQMQGEAHIITKKRPFAARIFDPIMSALYNRP